MGARSRVTFVLVVLTATLGGCIWPEFRYDPANHGEQPLEFSINPSNVSRLTQA